jgi:cell division protein FtsW (lipid II flippase)
MAAEATAGGPVTFRRRRNLELVLLLLAQSVGWGGYMLTHLNRDNALPQYWVQVTVVWVCVGLLAHSVVRWRTPYADPILLPCVVVLVGVGLAALHRYTLDFDPDYPPDFSMTAQIVAVCLGVVGLWVVLIVLRDLRRLAAYPFLLSAGALVLLLLPLVPYLGIEINGSRIWINLFGFSLQPAEIAKIVLAAGFAAYLTEKREMLSSAGKRVLGLRLTRFRDIGPLLLMWGVSLVIMMWERDLGTSLLFFGLFTVMLFIATGQVRWLVVAAVLAAAGGVAAWRLFDHVRRRVDFWLHPEDFPDTATQILSAEYGMAAGGLAGEGWGLGRPELTPFYFNDMIAPSLAEEIGLTGLMGLILVYGLIGFRGLRTALQARDDFTKLFAAGLSFGFLLQAFTIIAGSTRLLPLTGLTSPYLSQGGSSMIANWLLLALLLLTSHQVRKPPEIVPVDLADEQTLTLSARQLHRLHVGAAAPLLAVPADLVKEDDTTVTVPPAAGDPAPAEPGEERAGQPGLAPRPLPSPPDTADAAETQALPPPGGAA